MDGISDVAHVLCNKDAFPQGSLNEKHLQIMSSYKFTSKTHSSSTEDFGKFFIDSLIDLPVDTVGNFLDPYTVPFWLIRLSRVTRPVVLAEFHQLSQVTAPLADDLWWIRKTVKKGFFKKYLQLWVMLNVLYFNWADWSMRNIFEVQEQSRKSDLILDICDWNLRKLTGCCFNLNPIYQKSLEL